MIITYIEEENVFYSMPQYMNFNSIITVKKDTKK